jgi:mediator of RNA polymerase II transcription subunit 6
VLFYFATSPFFDQVSGNQSLLTQWAGTPNQNDILGTRQKFESHLRHQRGTQYVVEHDPLEAKVFIDGPNGREPSNVWVIRKQHRENDSDSGVTPLGYYYIVNDVIYQAPSIASVLNYRMLNTVSALDKVFLAPSDLSFFSVSHGHTYYKHVQKSTTQALATTSQPNKEDTPLPGARGSTGDKPPTATATSQTQAQDDFDNSARTLREALRMTLQYGKEYMDDVPLVGEPGNFRLNKTKDSVNSQPKSQASGAATETPGQSRAPSVVPASAATHTPSVSRGTMAAAGDKKGNATNRVKPKRRKSKAGDVSP